MPDSELLKDAIRVSLREENVPHAMASLKKLLQKTGSESIAQLLEEVGELALWEFQCGASPDIVYEFLRSVRKRQGDEPGMETCERLTELYRDMKHRGVDVHDFRACRSYAESLYWEGASPTDESRVAYEKSIGYWRQMRLLSAIDPVLSKFPGSTWLTVGDGRSAIEARYISKRGSHGTPSDFTDFGLKAALDAGLISEYLITPVEKLAAEDGSYDFVLAKDMLHHVARPWMGLYEMVRVAREGICFIEPYDHSFYHSLLTPIVNNGSGRTIPWHGFEEDVSNYIYSFTEREVAKFCMGLGLPFLACKGFADYYRPELDRQEAIEGSQVVNELKALLSDLESKASQGKRGYELIAHIILKKPPLSPLRASLRDAGFQEAHLRRNSAMEKALVSSTENIHKKTAS